MKKQLVALYDKKAMMYLHIQAVPSIGSVIRELQDACNGGDQMLSKHPNDFVLCRFGTFDDNTGVFELGLMPEQIQEVAGLLYPAKLDAGAVAPGAGVAVQAESGL